MQVKFSGTIFVKKFQPKYSAETKYADNVNQITRDTLSAELKANVLGINRLIENDKAIVGVFDATSQLYEASALLKLSQHQQPFYATRINSISDKQIQIESNRIFEKESDYSILA